MIEGAIVEGRHCKTAKAKRYTCVDLIDRYVASILPQKSHSLLYMQTLQLTWWKVPLGHCVLADITPALSAEYRDKLAHSDGRHRANSTVRRHLAVLSHAFPIAVREWGWLDDSPMRKVSKPKEPCGKIRFLSDEERLRLLDACKVSGTPYLYTVIVLALSTGARRGELLHSHGQMWT